MVDIAYIKKTLKQFCGVGESSGSDALTEPSFTASSLSLLNSIQLGVSIHALLRSNQLRDYIDTSTIADDSPLFMLMMCDDASSLLTYLLPGIAHAKDQPDLENYKHLGFSHLQLIQDLRDILGADKKLFDQKIINELNSKITV